MEPVPSFGAAPGPQCPVHGVPALGACARCGRFLCRDCQAAEPTLCTECGVRSADALGLGAQGLTVRNALGLSLRLMRLGAPVIAASVALGAVVGTLLDQVAASVDTVRLGNLLDRLYDVSVGQVLTITVVATLLRASAGRPLTFKQALGEGFSAWGRVFVARFRAGLLILLFTLLLVVPGVLKALSLAFVTIYAWKNDGADPLDQSNVLTHERRGVLFGVLTVAFLLFMLWLLPSAVVVGAASELLPALALPLDYVLNVLVLSGSHFLDAVVVACFLLLTNEKARAEV